MRILITNDDGIDAYGVKLLEEIARSVSEDILVVAPMDNRSGTAQSITLWRDIHLAKIDDQHYACSGTPADCVMLALHHLMTDNPPDLILSGINHGMNAADDIGYSGTIGAAREAAIIGLRAFAFSQRNGRTEADFGPARKYGQQVLDYLLSQPFVPRTVLNVNFPSLKAGPVQGIRPAGLDRHKLSDQIIASDIPNHFRIGPLNVRTETDPGTDRALMDSGYITVTPLKLNTTDQDQLAALPDASVVRPG